MNRALLLLALPLLLPTPAFAHHLGDDWETAMRQLYEAPDGRLVLLTATFRVYADWPLQPDRISALGVRAVPLGGGPAVALGHPTLRFEGVAGDSVRYALTVTADGLAWHTTWAWRAYNACGPTTMQKPRLMLLQASNSVDKYAVLGGAEAVLLADLLEAEALTYLDAGQGAGDPVRGDLADGGFTILDGAWLRPVGILGNPEGDLISGEAGARKVDPGPDGWWNCNYGNLPI